MSSDDFIGIDRKFALLVVIDAFHRLTYQKVKKALLAQAVKNTSLRHWYPESRELPKKDPYKDINHGLTMYSKWISPSWKQ